MARGRGKEKQPYSTAVPPMQPETQHVPRDKRVLGAGLAAKERQGVPSDGTLEAAAAVRDDVRLLAPDEVDHREVHLLRALQTHLLQLGQLVQAPVRATTPTRPSVIASARIPALSGRIRVSHMTTHTAAAVSYLTLIRTPARMSP